LPTYEGKTDGASAGGVGEACGAPAVGAGAADNELQPQSSRSASRSKYLLLQKEQTKLNIAFSPIHQVIHQGREIRGSDDPLLLLRIAEDPIYFRSGLHSFLVNYLTVTSHAPRIGT
jgi:hypothetical protein